MGTGQTRNFEEKKDEEVEVEVEDKMRRNRTSRHHAKQSKGDQSRESSDHRWRENSGSKPDGANEIEKSI
jgi:hypothetical protein